MQHTLRKVLSEVKLRVWALRTSRCQVEYYLARDEYGAKEQKNILNIVGLLFVESRKSQVIFHRVKCSSLLVVVKFWSSEFFWGSYNRKNFNIPNSYPLDVRAFVPQFWLPQMSTGLPFLGFKVILIYKHLAYSKEYDLEDT